MVIECDLVNVQRSISVFFFFVLLLSVMKRTNEKYSLASHYSFEFDQAALRNLLAVYLHVEGF